MHFNVKRLACVKGNQYLFRNLSFILSPGELLLIQGPNGSGKSSLLKILAGLASYERGSIETASEIAYLGHKEGIKRGLSVLENIALQGVLAKSFQRSLDIRSILKTFKIYTERDKLCGALSMGQRRKVALAGLLLKQKPLWIIDEPFTGLDKESIASLCKYFSSHLSKEGMIIIASHTLEGMKAHQTIELPTC